MTTRGKRGEFWCVVCVCCNPHHILPWLKWFSWRAHHRLSRARPSFSQSLTHDTRRRDEAHWQTERRALLSTLVASLNVWHSLHAYCFVYVVEASSSVLVIFNHHHDHHHNQAHHHRCMSRTHLYTHLSNMNQSINQSISTLT